MKKFFFSAFILIALGATAQEKEKVQAAKGVVYGEVSNQDKSIAADELKNEAGERPIRRPDKSQSSRSV